MYVRDCERLRLSQHKSYDGANLYIFSIKPEKNTRFVWAGNGGVRANAEVGRAQVTRHRQRRPANASPLTLPAPEVGQPPTLALPCPPQLAWGPWPLLTCVATILYILPLGTVWMDVEFLIYFIYGK